MTAAFLAATFFTVADFFAATFFTAADFFAATFFTAATFFAPTFFTTALPLVRVAFATFVGVVVEVEVVALALIAFSPARALELVEVFVAVLFFAPDFFAAGFFAADFLGAVFLGALFFTATFLAETLLLVASVGGVTVATGASSTGARAGEAGATTVERSIGGVESAAKELSIEIAPRARARVVSATEVRRITRICWEMQDIGFYFLCIIKCSLFLLVCGCSDECGYM